VAAPRKVLLDTDIGSDVDDALALGLMLMAPEALDLVAVTTVSRDAAVRARVAAGLLGLGGRGDVEVCIGEARPILRGENRFVWFGHEERCIVEGPAASITAEPASERIVRAARETRALELLAVGPLTNVARALALDPELPERLAGLTIMGGQVRGERIGRQQGGPSFEYNLCSDPEATVAVLGAGFRTTLVTADVTLSTWLRDADVEQLAAAGPLARALGASLEARPAEALPGARPNARARQRGLSPRSAHRARSPRRPGAPLRAAAYRSDRRGGNAAHAGGGSAARHRMRDASGHRSRRAGRRARHHGDVVEY